MPMNAPFAGFPPELLAQIAQGAFRPPQAMGMQAPGGMSMPQMGGGGMGLGEGMAGLGAGLGMMGKMGGGISEQGAVGPGGLAGAVSGIDALKPDANGVWQPPPMPTDIGYGQGGGGGGFMNWVRGLF
jgi:hypothetical protein